MNAPREREGAPVVPDAPAADAAPRVADVALHARASTLFLALRVLSAAERDAALAGVATDDAPLAGEVRSLLAFDADDVQPATDIPARLGPYRVLGRLGQGGSGQVFLAEQDEPVRRRVAIKVVPQAAVNPELAARFEVERRALEATDHPNITRVLDAGRTPDGLPYLVMNLVEGEPLTRYCERRALTIAERVRLMLDVADAVQHAHQRGVIHRDLKPGNILVTESDGRPVPQVLDFGIAKPVAGMALADSPPTVGLPLGTPAYMAPEQTGLGEVDTRADVYALGAVLHELVAGAPPVHVGGDPLAALRAIRESVPPPASRVRTPPAGSRAALADLDVIIGKALEKRPERRYASVGALGDDLRRLLACEPIAARAPSWTYRARRFARRNRVLVAAGALVLLALGLGIAGLAAGLVEARRQQAAAQDQTDAQIELNRFLTDDLLAAASPERDGREVTVMALLDRASRLVDSRFPTRPIIAAAVHHALGEAYAALGAYDIAGGHLQRAVAMRREASGAESLDTLHSEIAAASLLGLRGRWQEAHDALVPLIARARTVLGPGDPALYAALNDMGVTLLSLGRAAEAGPALQEALAGRRRLLGTEDPLIAVTTSNLAQVLDGQGEAEGALAMLVETLRVLDAGPDGAPMMVLGLENNIGATLQDLDRDAEAEPHLRRAAALAAQLLGPEHPDTLTLQSNLAGLQADTGDLAGALALFEQLVARRTQQLGPTALDTLTTRYGYWNAVWKSGRDDEAAAGFTALLADVTAALGGEHVLAAQTESALARALLDAGRPQDALPHAERAAARLAELLGAEHARTRTAQQMLATIRGGG
ncbi:MAG TPA: serine/threonine-protein kinase [Planctomycetota bacterium]|nr:serine/threonine-protein kinase [Planctomycetota bacterium]